MTVTRPGVYVSEAPLNQVVPVNVATGTFGCFIGTALKGPTVPVLVRSWTDYENYFGGWSNNVSLPLAMHQFFSNGGGQAYVRRVLNKTGVNASTATFDDDWTTMPGDGTNDRLVLTAVSPGIWGNKIAYSIRTYQKPTGRVDTEGDQIMEDLFELVIREQRTNVLVVVERFPDLSMQTGHRRYVENIVNSYSIGSIYITILDPKKEANALPLAKDSGNDPIFLSDGDDGTGEPDGDSFAAAFEDFDGIDGCLIVNVPGTSSTKTLELAVKDRGDSVLLVDPDPDSTLDDLTWLPDTSYGAAYYPYIYISDPDPSTPRGSITAVPPGASVAGLIVRTEVDRGVFKAPAGVSASLYGAVATKTRLTNEQADLCASMNLNAIRSLAGIGVSVMGARTRSNDIAQYLSVRRTLNYVKRRSSIVSRFALFEPNTPKLWEQLRVANGSFLSELWLAGGLSGAYANEAFYVKVDRDNNTPQTMENGELHIEIGVAPVFPAEFIIIRIGQYEAGATVTVQEG